MQSEIELVPIVGQKDTCTPIHPSYWSITYQQLLDVEEEAKNIFGWWGYPTKSMRDINRHIIAPLCQKTERSYALSLNPQGLKIDAFVTHCWDEPFLDFCHSIRRAFHHFAQRPNLWICSFALVQGSSHRVQQQLGISIRDSPFVQALSKASWFVVVRNSKKDLYSRIWCVCELMFAREFGFTTTNRTIVVGPNKFASCRSSCTEAQASTPHDKRKILEALARVNGGLEAIDQLVLQYRMHDGDELFHPTRPIQRFWYTALLIAVLLASLIIAFGRKPQEPSLVHIFGRSYNRVGTTEIDLTAKNLSTTIPSEIALLSDLVDLRLRSNQLHGPIPTHLGLLESLETLTIWEDHLTGSIPTEIGLMSSLDHMDLILLNCASPIPSEVGLLTALCSLRLVHGFSGTIPTELAMLKNLTHLELYGNDLLDGSVPSEIGVSTTMTALSIEMNQLRSTLPTELGLLTGLTLLDLSSNQLSGTIPTAIGLLTAMTTLRLSSNMLSGSLPTEVESIAWLSGLYVFDNALTGQVPTELGSGRNGSHLTGSMQPEVNHFSGTAPTELGELRLLTACGSTQPAGYRFSGTVLTELRELRLLTARANLLSGPIPSELGWLMARPSSLADHSTGSMQPASGPVNQQDHLSCPLDQCPCNRTKYFDLKRPQRALHCFSDDRTPSSSWFSKFLTP